MSHAVIEVGETFHLFMARDFKEDVRRHFVGRVMAVSEGAFRAEGYTFAYNQSSSAYRRLPELRTRIFGILNGNYVLNILPPELLLDNLRYNSTSSGGLFLVDRAGFSLEIHEANVMLSG